MSGTDPKPQSTAGGSGGDNETVGQEHDYSSLYADNDTGDLHKVDGSKVVEYQHRADLSPEEKKMHYLHTEDNKVKFYGKTPMHHEFAEKNHKVTGKKSHKHSGRHVRHHEVIDLAEAKTDAVGMDHIAKAGSVRKHMGEIQAMMVTSLSFLFSEGAKWTFMTDPLMQNMNELLEYQGFNVDHIRKLVSHAYRNAKKNADEYRRGLMILTTTFYKWGNIKHNRLQSMDEVWRKNFNDELSVVGIILRGAAGFKRLTDKDALTLPRIASAHPEMVGYALLKQFLKPRELGNTTYDLDSLPAIMRYPNFMSLVRKNVVTDEVYQDLLHASFSYTATLDQIVNKGKLTPLHKIWSFHLLGASTVVLKEEQSKMMLINSGVLDPGLGMTKNVKQVADKIRKLNIQEPK